MELRPKRGAGGAVHVVELGRIADHVIELILAGDVFDVEVTPGADPVILRNPICSTGEAGSSGGRPVGKRRGALIDVGRFKRCAASNGARIGFLPVLHEVRGTPLPGTARVMEQAGERSAVDEVGRLHAREIGEGRRPVDVADDR